MTPPCVGDADREEVLLSATGTIWSYTTCSFPPPAPYVITTEPFEPIVLAAVELDEEQLVVMGQMATGVGVDDLSVGMPVRMILDVLYERR